MAPLVKQKQLRVPASSGAVRAVFLRLYAKRRRGHDARNRGFRLASCSRGLVFLRGILQAQRAEDNCSQMGTLQTRMPNEATDGLAPSVLDSFPGAARAASCEFPPASEEDSRRETPGSDSHLTPQAWCSRKETLQAQRAEDWCSQKGTLQIHKGPTRLPAGWHRRFLPFFQAHLEQILVLFRQRAKKDPTRDTTGSDWGRAPVAWYSRTGTLKAQIATRLLTLLSNTPQTKWCYSRSPHPILHRGPPRRLLWTSCHTRARSST